MTLHHAPECPHCHQPAIVQSSLYAWECLNCGFKRDLSQPSSPAQDQIPPLWGLAWTIASAFVFMALLGITPELPSLRLSLGTEVSEPIVFGSPDQAPITIEVVANKPDPEQTNN